MLYGGSGTGNQNDPYKTAVIDTIVAEVQSVPGEDRCVLLLGYKDQIVDMFQVNNILLFVRGLLVLTPCSLWQECQPRLVATLCD
jgi:hypothetical protein